MQVDFHTAADSTVGQSIVTDRLADGRPNTVTHPIDATHDHVVTFGYDDTVGTDAGGHTRPAVADDRGRNQGQGAGRRSLADLGDLDTRAPGEGPNGGVTFGYNELWETSSISGGRAHCLLPIR